MRKGVEVFFLYLCWWIATKHNFIYKKNPKSLKPKKALKSNILCKYSIQMMSKVCTIGPRLVIYIMLVTQQ